MSDPTRITINEEPELMITKEDALEGIPFVVEVENNPIRFAHEKQAASRGAELSPGQTHTLSNFRDREIWFAAPDGPAEVRARKAGAKPESQPTQEVEVSGGSISSSTSNKTGLKTQTIIGSGSFNSDVVPDAVDVVIKAGEGNVDTIKVDGFPLASGQAISLSIQSPDIPSINMNDPSDQAHAIYEVNS